MEKTNRPMPPRDFTIELASKRVAGLNGGEIRLTPTEWGIVEILVRHHGKLVTQARLLKEV